MVIKFYQSVIFLFFFLAMSKLRGSLFGGPAPFSQAQLPTYLQVGKQFLQTQIDFRDQNPNGKISNYEVAKEVNFVYY